VGALTPWLNTAPFTGTEAEGGMKLSTGRKWLIGTVIALTSLIFAALSYFDHFRKQDSLPSIHHNIRGSGNNAVNAGGNVNIKQ